MGGCVGRRRVCLGTPTPSRASTSWRSCAEHVADGPPRGGFPAPTGKRSIDSMNLWITRKRVANPQLSATKGKQVRWKRSDFHQKCLISMEPARGIEPPTCGLQISGGELLKSLMAWAIPSPSLRISPFHIIPLCFNSSLFSLLRRSS